MHVTSEKRSPFVPKINTLSKILKYWFVDVAGIDQQNYYITGSYALREHRDISDLDVCVDYNEFFKLGRLTGMGKLEFHNGQIRWFFDLTKEYNDIRGTNETNISVEAFQKLPHEGFPNERFSMKYLKSHGGLTVDVNGHQYLNLRELLEWKKVMERPKDIEDIKLIEMILFE